jgi:hypothetical protein
VSIKLEGTSLPASMCQYAVGPYPPNVDYVVSIRAACSYREVVLDTEQSDKTAY